MPQRVLVVDDEKLPRWSLSETLRDHLEVEVEEADSAEAMLEKTAEKTYDLVMLDVGLPGISGVQGLGKLRERGDKTPVIMVTANNDDDTVMACLNLGAFDYVCKPVELAAIEAVVKRALTRKETNQKNVEKPASTSEELANFIGHSAPLEKVREQARRVIERGANTILIRGESGTGKDVLARAMHRASSHADQPFMDINCTALPAHLLESELFGHEKGAFTDAKNQKRGLFEVAASGTVLLDEIGDMEPVLQAKLLRVLEERRFKRVGGVHDIDFKACVIGTTNVDLERAIEEGRFRKDLYYRLNVVPIVIPPLRARPDDIPLLIEHFLRLLSKELQTTMTSISFGAMCLLCRYQWPGNVRELKNLLERIMVLESGDTILVDHLPPQIRSTESCEESTDNTERESAETKIPIPMDSLDLETMEKEMIRQALDRTDGNLTRAGELLGLHRDTLRYRARKYELID